MALQVDTTVENAVADFEALSKEFAKFEVKSTTLSISQTIWITVSNVVLFLKQCRRKIRHTCISWTPSTPARPRISRISPITSIDWAKLRNLCASSSILCFSVLTPEYYRFIYRFLFVSRFKDVSPEDKERIEGLKVDLAQRKAQLADISATLPAKNKSVKNATHSILLEWSKRAIRNLLQYLPAHCPRQRERFVVEQGRTVMCSFDWLIACILRHLSIDWLIDWLHSSSSLDWLIDWIDWFENLFQKRPDSDFDLFLASFVQIKVQGGIWAF